MPKFIDITGDVYGRLTVIEYEGKSKHGHSVWLCECECGNLTKVSKPDLKQNKTNSCGCLKKEMLSIDKDRANKGGLARKKQLTTHGESHTRLYNIWKAMKQRCLNPNNSDYKDYGGRGITVCEEWLSFNNFKTWATLTNYDNNAPYGACTLDRIDNNKGYSPSNCRWVGSKTQANNRRKKGKINEKET